MNTEEKHRHRLCAMMHCSSRIRERLNRKAEKLDIDKIRLALVHNNDDCFLRREYPNAITGIVRFQNRWTTAVFDKDLGVVASVGVSL